MQQSIKFGKILGIPIGMHYTWVIAAVLITLSLVAQFHAEHALWPPALSVALGVATSVLFFASIVAHELGHSVVALHFGIPVRSITLFVFGGVAEIERDADRPIQEFLIAIAGPAVSLLLAALFKAIDLVARSRIEPLADVVQWLALINFWVVLFNLIPGFPLDGGRVLRSVVWAIKGNFRAATSIAAGAGKLFAYLFILGGIWVGFGGNWASGIWLAFIGWFLLNAAQATTGQLTIEEALRGVTAADLMSSDCAAVSPAISLDEFVRDHVMRTARRCFLVADGGRILGLITAHNLSKAERDDWPRSSVQSVMTPMDRLKWVRPEETALQVLQTMSRENINQLPVIAEGKLLGMIARDSVLNRIHLFLELGQRRL